MTNPSQFEFITLIKYLDFIVRDHQIRGKRLLPGAAMLDILYRALHENDFPIGEMELRDILFKRPLDTDEDYDRKIRLKLTQQEDHWDITIESMKISQHQALTNEWEENLEAKLHLGCEIGDKRINLQSLLDLPGEQREMEACYQAAREMDIKHLDLMKALGDINDTENYLLAKIHLGELAEQYLDYCYLHPTLLDASLLVSFLLIGGKGKGPRIPFHISRFIARDRLCNPCYVYLKKEDAARGYINHCNVEVYDENGKLLVLFERLSFKGMRSRERERVEETASADQPLHSPTPDKVRQHPAPSQFDTPPEVITQDLRNMVADKVSKAPHEISVNVGFYSLGLDSLMLLELVAALRDKIGQPLYPTLFFEYSNIADLAEYLAENFGAFYPHGDSDQAKPVPARAPEATPSLTPESAAPRKKSIGQRNETFEDIAIIGVAGNYPQADTLDQLWENLCKGRDSVTEIPATRWDLNRWYDSDRNKKGKTYSKWGGFLNHVDHFDPLLFKISPKEAELLDPQERLFLQTAYHTIEDAGYRAADLTDDNSVGVYVGVMWGHYQMCGNGKDSTSSTYWSIANRVSYFFDFQGPCMAVDTACSSSLTTIHLACESLHKGECKVAIAGGVNVSVHPEKYLYLSQGRYTS
ncbi:MAG: hypothetical protein GY731_00745, partial [Gammaproteobacteria bacterium]|nr:hypothetical protein [Gammaproteobacteria bacterium]